MKLVSLDELLKIDKFKLTESNREGFLTRFFENIPNSRIYGKSGSRSKASDRNMDGKFRFYSF